MKNKAPLPVTSPGSRGVFLNTLCLVSCLLLTSCSVGFISKYDAQTDHAVTALQRKIETFFVTLESQIGTPEALHSNHDSFYREAQVDISAIKLRTSALPKNELTQQQVELLENNLELLEGFHKEGIRTIEATVAPRDDFNTALSNILKLELTKRRGEKP